MELIETKSFELAIHREGDGDSDKLALILPGRLDTKDYAHNVSHVQFLGSKGYLAVSFDAPGSWESPGGIEIYSTTNYIKATNELIEYFGNRPTLLMGHSRGGAVSILAGSDNPTVETIVPVMANYEGPAAPRPESVKLGFQKSHRDFPPGDTKTVEQKEFLLPIQYFKDGEQYDTASVLKQCTKRKFIFYGTDDEFTEPEVVEKLYAEIPEPKAIHKLTSKHDYRYNKETISEVNEVLWRFLNQV